MALNIEDEFRRLTGELRLMNRNFDAIQRGLAGRDRAADLLEESLEGEAKRRKEEDLRGRREKQAERRQRRYEGEHRARQVERFFGSLGTGVNNASTALKALSVAVLGGLGGGLVAGLIDFSTGLTKTYTEMADIGQTFNGDVFKMASEAAAAGLGLNEFSTMLKRSSVTASIMAKAGTSLPQLAKQVRDGSEQVGMFGFSLSQLNDITATYADQMRLSGSLESMNTKQAAEDIKGLARSVSGLSIVFGKSRDEIMKTWDKAMHHEQVVAAKMMMTQEQLSTFNKGFGQAIMTLAGQPGKLGEILSEMAAEAAGSGTAVFSTGAKTFIDAGMGQVVSMMEEMRDRIAANPDDADAATVDMMRKMKSAIQANLPSLKEQALAGNEAAKAVIMMGSEMRDVTVDELKAARKRSEEQQKYTKFMLNLENIWNRITGNIRSYLIDRLGDTINKLADEIDAWVGSADFQKFTADLITSGRNVAKVFGMVFDANGALDVKETAKRFKENLDALGQGISTVSSYFKVFTDTASSFGGLIKGMFGVKSGEGFPDLLVGLVGVIAGFKALGLLLTGIGKIGGMIINAKIVRLVNGTPGGGGLDGGGGGDGRDRKQGRGRGRLRDMGGAAVSGMKFGAVGTALEAMGALNDIRKIYGEEMSPEERKKALIDALIPRLGGVGGAIAGGALGGAAGSVIPGVGTAVGGIVGSVAGSFGGDYLASVLADQIISSQQGATNGVPREPEALRRARETLAQRERQLADQERETGDANTALVEEVRRLRDEVSRQTSVLAGQNAQQMDQQRRDQRSLQDILQAGP